MIRPLLLATLVSTFLSACAAPLAGPAQGPVTVGIIAINDFHGALEPPRQAVRAPDGKGGSVAVPAGGAAWLASAVDQLRGKYAHHLTVGAGDLIGASQLASSIHLDEPAVGVMNRIGLDFTAVGNHEFDRGRAELLRIQNGGCAQHTTRKPCQVERFSGARYRLLAASTITETGKPLFPATALRHFGQGRRKVTVGLIGLTLKGTPELVSPDGIRGLTFADEAATINAAVPRLKARGADAVIVLIHQGGRTAGPPDPDGCEGLDGEIRPILERLDPRVDVVVSGHTHQAYVCDWGKVDPARPFLLTSAGVYGGLVTDIALDIDPAANRVVARRADNVIVQSAGYRTGAGAVEPTDLLPRFAPRADVAAYVRQYTDAADAFARRPIGRLSASATREGTAGGALGALIADSQLAATRSAGAQIALTNPFGIRAPLQPGADGALTFADLYAVQPFNNTLVTQTMTGAELKAVLEQGLDDNGPNQLLAASEGFAWQVDLSRPAGSRVVAMALGGEPIRAEARYRVTTNNFLAGGGDGFSAFAQRREAVIGAVDLDAMEAWIAAVPLRAVPVEARVTVTGQAAPARP